MLDEKLRSEKEDSISEFKNLTLQFRMIIVGFANPWVGLHICSFIQQTLLSIHLVSGTALDAGNSALLKSLLLWKL